MMTFQKPLTLLIPALAMILSTGANMHLNAQSPYHNYRQTNSNSCGCGTDRQEMIDPISWAGANGSQRDRAYPNSRFEDTSYPAYRQALDQYYRSLADQQARFYSGPNAFGFQEFDRATFANVCPYDARERGRRESFGCNQPQYGGRVNDLQEWQLPGSSSYNRGQVREPRQEIPGRMMPPQFSAAAADQRPDLRSPQPYDSRETNPQQLPQIEMPPEDLGAYRSQGPDGRQNARTLPSMEPPKVNSTSPPINHSDHDHSGHDHSSHDH